MDRHATDLVSLAFGMLFFAIGAVLLADERLALAWEWLAPAMVMGFGGLLIAAGWRQRRPADEA